MKLHENKELFADAILAASLPKQEGGLGIKSIFIEKDYWICRSLSLMVENDQEERAIFKGGTSLTKAYGIGSRFSEDIDIAIAEAWSLSGNQLKSLIRKTAKNMTLGLSEINIPGSKQIAKLNDEKSALCQQHKQDIAKLRNVYKGEIGKAIRENERLNKAIKDKDAHIAKQDKRIDELDRKANPQRYHLSSGAELVHHFIPNLMYPSLHIWTKVGDEEYDVSSVSYDLVKQFSEDQITLHELVNEVFEPWEQVSEAQANLLDQAFILACGGEGQIRVGTGSGGYQSELPWRDKDKNKNRGVRR